MLADRNSYAVQAEASARRPLSVRPSGVSQGGLQHRPPPAGLSVMPPEPPVAADRLLTDRSAYMTYLETQVERVTTACLGYEGFDTKITSLTTNQTALEDKVVNLAKLVSSGQQYSEQCTSDVKSTMERVIPRLEALEKREKVFGTLLEEAEAAVPGQSASAGVAANAVGRGLGGALDIATLDARFTAWAGKHEVQYGNFEKRLAARVSEHLSALERASHSTRNEVSSGVNAAREEARAANVSLRAEINAALAASRDDILARLPPIAQKVESVRGEALHAVAALREEVMNTVATHKAEAAANLSALRDDVFGRLQQLAADSDAGRRELATAIERLREDVRAGLADAARRAAADRTEADRAVHAAREQASADASMAEARVTSAVSHASAELSERAARTENTLARLEEALGTTSELASNQELEVDKLRREAVLMSNDYKRFVEASNARWLELTDYCDAMTQDARSEVAVSTAEAAASCAEAAAAAKEAKESADAAKDAVEAARKATKKAAKEKAADTSHLSVVVEDDSESPPEPEMKVAEEGQEGNDLPESTTSSGLEDEAGHEGDDANIVKDARTNSGTLTVTVTDQPKAAGDSTSQQERKIEVRRKAPHGAPHGTGGWISPQVRPASERRQRPVSRIGPTESMDERLTDGIETIRQLGFGFARLQLEVGDAQKRSAQMAESVDRLGSELMQTLVQGRTTWQRQEIGPGGSSQTSSPAGTPVRAAPTPSPFVAHGQPPLPPPPPPVSPYHHHQQQEQQYLQQPQQQYLQQHAQYTAGMAPPPLAQYHQYHSSPSRPPPHVAPTAPSTNSQLYVAPGPSQVIGVASQDAHAYVQPGAYAPSSSQGGLTVEPSSSSQDSVRPAPNVRRMLDVKIGEQVHGSSQPPLHSSTKNTIGMDTAQGGHVELSQTQATNMMGSLQMWTAPSKNTVGMDTAQGGHVELSQTQATNMKESLQMWTAPSTNTVGMDTAQGGHVELSQTQATNMKESLQLWTTPTMEPSSSSMDEPPKDEPVVATAKKMDALSLWMKESKDETQTQTQKRVDSWVGEQSTADDETETETNQDDDDGDDDDTTTVVTESESSEPVKKKKKLVKKKASSKVASKSALKSEASSSKLSSKLSARPSSTSVSSVSTTTSLKRRTSVASTASTTSGAKKVLKKKSSK